MIYSIELIMNIITALVKLSHFSVEPNVKCAIDLFILWPPACWACGVIYRISCRL